MNIPKMLFRIGLSRYSVPEVRLEHLNITISLIYNPTDLANRQTSQFEILENTRYSISHTLFN